MTKTYGQYRDSDLVLWHEAEELIVTVGVCLYQATVIETHIDA